MTSPCPEYESSIPDSHPRLAQPPAEGAGPGKEPKHPQFPAFPEISHNASCTG